MTAKENESFLLTFPEGWKSFFESVKDNPDFLTVVQRVSKEAEEKTVYPPMQDVYRAFFLTPADETKVVILGQDPYFNHGQANGLAFSVGKGTALPPSLVNIYKELSYEFGYPIPKKNGDLTKWAKQGVLLLNATLTVRAGEPNSHSTYGWDKITDMAISYLDSLDRPMVYLLWGSYAGKKAKLIKSSKALVVKTAHPSPLSANKGFFCSDCFYRCNQFLEKNNMTPIDFRISDDDKQSDKEPTQKL